MDEASPSIKSRLCSVIECPICLNSFTDPRILPCHHSMCAGCIRDLIQVAQAERRTNIKCPCCRRQIPIPTGEDFFPAAFVMNHLCDLVKASDGTKCHLCLKAGISTMADCLCLQCVEFICSGCKVAHDAYHPLHHCVDCTSITADTLKEALVVKSQQECHIHRKELEYLCKDCNQLLCVTCKLTEERHEKHKTQYAKDPGVIQDYRNKLKEFSAECKKHKSVLTNVMEKQLSDQKRTNSEFDDVVQKIKYRSQAIQAAVLKYEAELISKVKNSRRRYYTDAKQSQTEIEQTRDAVENIHQAMMSAERSENHVDLFKAINQIDEHRRELASCTINQVAVCKLDFELGHEIPDVAAVFGSLGERHVVSSANVGEFDLEFAAFGIAVDSNDNILVAEANGTKLMAYSHFGNVVTTFDTSDVLKKAWGVHHHNDSIYVTDVGAKATRVYNNDNDTWSTIDINVECSGVCVTGDKQQLLMTSSVAEGVIYSTPVDGSGTTSVFVKHPDMKGPLGIAGRNDMVVVCCGLATSEEEANSSNNILCFDATGQLKFTHGGYPKGSGENQLDVPLGVAIDRDMNIIVADASNRRIKFLSEKGDVLGCVKFDGHPVALGLMENGTLIISQGTPNKIIKLRYAVGRKLH